MLSANVDESDITNTALPEGYRLFTTVRYTDPSFNALLPQFEQFANSEDGLLLTKELLEIEGQVHLLQRPQKHKQDIRRALALGMALHQQNEKDPEENRFRAHEKDELSGKSYPYAIHVLRIVKEALEMDLDTDTVIAACFHDTKEDCRITVNDTVLESQELVERLQGEFSDYDTIQPLIDMLSYVPEEIEEKDKKILRASRMYRIAEKKYTDTLVTQNKADSFMSEPGQEDIDSRIIKAIYSLGRIFEKAREYAGDDDERYFDLVIKGLLLKSLDSYDNMGSNGMKPASSLRNRILIHCSRLLGCYIDNKLMDRFVTNDARDPFNPGKTYAPIAAELHHESSTLRTRNMTRLLNIYGLDAVVKKRYQVTMGDESTFQPAIQYVVSCDGTKIDQVKRILHDHGHVIFQPSKENNTLKFEEVNGKHLKIMNLNGRKTTIEQVCEKTRLKSGRSSEALRAYIRYDGDNAINPADPPDGWRYAQFDRPKPNFRNFPEASILYVPPGGQLREVMEVVSSLYHPVKKDYIRMLTYSQQYNSAN